MEVIPYFLSIIVTVLAVYWSAAQFHRKPGTPMTGIFRYPEETRASAARSEPLAGGRGRPGPPATARGRIR